MTSCRGELDQGGELQALGHDGPIKTVAKVECCVGEEYPGLSKTSVLALLQTPGYYATVTFS